MSSASGLDQLCAAATGLDAPNIQRQSEIRVVEIDAFASVADLIHAAILASGGSATLKEIYDVCERHGRIAYRRADGSRLITANDHWKSQVRHALYTGGRFQRMTSNADFWQLASAYSNTTAELIRVLVRADDPTVHIKASLSVLPQTESAGEDGEQPHQLAANNNNRQQQQQRGTGQQQSKAKSQTRRKRSMLNTTDQASGGDNCDSATAPLDDTKNDGSTPKKSRQVTIPTRFQPARQKRMQKSMLLDHDDDEYADDDYDGAPDDHSMLDEHVDDEYDTNARAMHYGGRTTTIIHNNNRQQYRPSKLMRSSSGINTNNNNTTNCYDDNDPADLRWGSTAYRSTIIISSPNDIIKMNHNNNGRHGRRAGSSEADSLPSPQQHYVHHHNNHNNITATTMNRGTLSQQKQYNNNNNTLAIPPTTALNNPLLSIDNNNKLPPLASLTIPPPPPIIAPSTLQKPPSSSITRASPDFSTVETPNDCKDAMAQVTPPLTIAQWTLAMKQLQESTTACSTVGGSASTTTPVQFAYWPGLFAAAAAGMPLMNLENTLQQHVVGGVGGVQGQQGGSGQQQQQQQQERAAAAAAAAHNYHNHHAKQ